MTIDENYDDGTLTPEEMETIRESYLADNTTPISAPTRIPKINEVHDTLWGGENALTPQECKEFYLIDLLSFGNEKLTARNWGKLIRLQKFQHIIANAVVQISKELSKIDPEIQQTLAQCLIYPVRDYETEPIE